MSDGHDQKVLTVGVFCTMKESLRRFCWLCGRRGPTLKTFAATSLATSTTLPVVALRLMLPLVSGLAARG